MRLWMPLGILCIAVLALSGCSTQNQGPVIESLNASATSVYVGHDVRLHVDAFDPEGHAMTVSWFTSEGSFTSIQETEAVWLATVPGLHAIQVELTDLFGASVRGTIEIEVKEHLVLAAGTQVTMELLGEVLADSVRIGDRLPLRVIDSIWTDGFEVIEAGAYGIAQVVAMQLPTGSTGSGSIVLAPTRVQLADGQVVNLGAGGDGPSAHTNTPGRQDFTFDAGQTVAVRPGARLIGALRDDARMVVNSNRLAPSEMAQPVPVSTAACLGIHGSNFSEYVISVYSEGVRVEGFMAGSLASRSGIQIGDRITGIRVGSEEYPIGSLSDLQRVERDLEPGDHVTLLVRNLLRKLDAPMTAGTCYVVP